MLIDPRLYSIPRWMASPSVSVPENGRLAMLPALPLNGPWTSIVGLSVFTLVVAPGTGASVATTEPSVPRPDSGTGEACEPAACPPPPCANALGPSHTVTTTMPASTRSGEPVRLITKSLSSAELVSKTPHAQGTQHERDGEQAQEIGPEIGEAAALEHAGAGDDGEMMDR